MSWRTRLPVREVYAPSGAQLQAELKAEYERQLVEERKRLVDLDEAAQAAIEADPASLAAFSQARAQIRESSGAEEDRVILAGVESLFDDGVLSRRQGRALLEAMEHRDEPLAQRVLRRYDAAVGR